MASPAALGLRAWGQEAPREPPASPGPCPAWCRASTASLCPLRPPAVGLARLLASVGAVQPSSSGDTVSGAPALGLSPARRREGSEGEIDSGQRESRQPRVPPAAPCPPSVLDACAGQAMAQAAGGSQPRACPAWVSDGSRYPPSVLAAGTPARFLSAQTHLVPVNRISPEYAPAAHPHIARARRARGASSQGLKVEEGVQGCSARGSCAESECMLTCVCACACSHACVCVHALVRVCVLRSV